MPQATPWSAVCRTLHEHPQTLMFEDLILCDRRAKAISNKVFRDFPVSQEGMNPYAAGVGKCSLGSYNMGRVLAIPAAPKKDPEPCRNYIDLGRLFHENSRGTLRNPYVLVITSLRGPQ